MNTLLSFILQVTAASGLLYGYYHFLLRNNRFHQYNRFYLLAATVISLIIPFLDIPLYFTAAEKESSFVLQTITAIAPEANKPSVVPLQTGPVHTGISLAQILVGAYVLIALLVLLRTVYSLLRIRQLIRKYPSGQLGGIRFVNTHEPGTPFSFFRWLFWNRDIELHSEKGQQVFRHEVYHIEQKHSLDLVYAELLTVCCWINPFFHLIKKELRAIHEFLADRFAINEQQKWEYAEMLLMQALGTKQSLINPFFQTHIKRRIAMITLSKKPGHQYARKLFALPVTAISIFLFAFSYHEKEPVNSGSSTEQPVQSRLQNTNPSGTVPVADTNRPDQQAGKIFGKTDIAASFPGGDAAWHQYILSNLDGKIPVRKNAPAGMYTTVIQFIVQKDGTLSGFKPLTHHGFGMEEEAMRVIRQSPAWKPAQHQGKPVNAYHKQPVTFLVKKQSGQADAAANTLYDENIVFNKVEKEAAFPGGENAFREYIARNQQQHSKTLATSPYTATVTVQFIVHTNGSVSDVAAIGADAASAYTTLAVNLVKNGPNWIPAVQNGKPVKAYKQQVFAFAPPAGNQNQAVTDLQSDYIQTMPELSVGELRQATVHQLLQLDKNTEIIDYVFSIDTDDGKVSEAVNNGNQFSALTRQLFQNAKAGKLISFDRIRIRLNGEVKKITSLVYRLVN